MGIAWAPSRDNISNISKNKHEAKAGWSLGGYNRRISLSFRQCELHSEFRTSLGYRVRPRREREREICDIKRTTSPYPSPNQLLTRQERKKVQITSCSSSMGLEQVEHSSFSGHPNQAERIWVPKKEATGLKPVGVGWDHCVSRLSAKGRDSN